MIPSSSFFASAVALLASTTLHIGNVAAQTSTDCQPLEKECPANSAFSMAYNFNMTSKPAAWNTTVGPVVFDQTKGATFTIAKQGESPTIRSQYYIFFGRVEIIMKAAPGTGIISSVMMLSDDLDEIDWEFLGINSTHALTNYFGKGIQDFTKGQYYPVTGGVQADYHNYTTLWTKDRLDWIIDGKIVRTLLPADANSTHNYPQTPMRVSLGIWAGSDPRLSEGTREWAGGDTDFTKGPFSMYVKQVYIEDFSSGKEYVYGDRSGTYTSIKVVSGESTANSTITQAQESEKSISDRWNELSSGAKTGVYVGGASFVALIGGALLFYFLRQRKRGQEEAKLAAERETRERMELEQYRKAGIDPDSLVQQTEYNGKDVSRDDLGSRGGIMNNEPIEPNSPLNEKAWGAPLGAAAVGGIAAVSAANAMRSPSMPLLHDDPHNRLNSPGPNNGGFGGQQQYFDQDPQRQQQQRSNMDPHAGMRSPGAASMMSPVRTASPGGPPPFPLPQTPGSPAGYGNNGRSFTAPTPRMGSPGPQVGGYGNDMQRMASPGPMNGPQRSYTNDPYRGPGAGGNGGHGGQQDGGNGYWR